MKNSLWSKLIIALICAFPLLAAQPSGNIRFAWDYPTNAVYLPNGVLDTNLYFKFYFTTSIVNPNWNFLSQIRAVDFITATNGSNFTFTSTVKVPVGGGFLTETVSNFWVESPFSDAIVFPQLPTDGSNLKAAKIETPQIWSSITSSVTNAPPVPK